MTNGGGNMAEYNYVLDAPFESDKFFEKVEHDMSCGKLVIDNHQDYVVTEMITAKLKINEYLDTLNSKFYMNMCVHNIIPLIGYVQTLFASSGSYINSEIMNLYIEYVIYKYLMNSVRVNNTDVKKMADNMMTVTINKINKLITS